jgi:hypothetical protein
VATGAFAQGISMAAGGGLLLDWSVGNKIKMGSREGELQNLSFGGFGFFDATYAELDVNFTYGFLDANYNFNYSGFFSGSTKANALQLGFSLLGKYPIGMNGFTLFPLLGADYNRVLSFMIKNEYLWDKPGGDSQFGLLAGAGLDFPFSSALFLRAEALFHYRFPSENMKSLGSSASTTPGLGPRIKIGVGYKFGGGSGSKSTASSTRSQSGRYMRVNADALNVRSKPSADSSLVGTLSRNTRVEVLESSGTWWKIKSGKIEGYVNSSYLK